MTSYSTDGTILRINNLNLAYGENVVLRGVTGEIKNLTRPDRKQGQIHALLGPSGIGKTQLLRKCAGLETPGAICSGDITVGDNNVHVRAGLVGVVAQNYPLFMHRKVLSNLTVAGKRVGLTKQAAHEKAMSLLDEFALMDKHNHWPAELSGGQRQRVAIAQQLMCSEHIILMDEPFSGLDPVMVDRVSGLIQQVSLKDEYNTVFVITHEISAAVAIADHIWVMGRDHNPDGSIVPGAYIKKEFNLIDMGLAWQPDIRKLPRYREFVGELRDMFKEL